MINDSFQLDIKDLFVELWQKKLFIIVFSGLFSVAGVLFSLSLPNIYKAEVLLAPNSADSQMQNLAGQLGGIAALTGISMGGGQSDKTAFGLEVLRSRAFADRFIQSRDILVPLMAIESWDASTNTVVIDPTLFDSEAEQWVREVKAPKEAKPSAWEAFKVFSENLTYERNSDSGFVRISYTSQSPYLAQQWLAWLVDDLNLWMKTYDTREIKNNIFYLNQQLKETNIAEMHKIFYQLIEEQTKKLMLAEAQAEYAFKIVDPAIVPEEKSSPRRALICILFSFFGGIMSVVLVLLNVIRKK
ncbi:Wzz/FepE/Etk N-terminal domain-containing protein [Shewanella waksmanii]|uniref:Wzz/FepE/Etk N-terminal domain-containing protein n=1 Tax=Shewanella waksmanii TaxID=213783 RepID=UPI00373611BA